MKLAQLCHIYHTSVHPAIIALKEHTIPNSTHVLWAHLVISQESVVLQGVPHVEVARLVVSMD